MNKCEGVSRYVNEFEVNYTNMSVSKVSLSLSLSKTIQGEVQYCKEAKVQVTLATISD